MFFIIADYIQKNFSTIFKKEVNLSPIMPIYDSDYDSNYDDTLCIKNPVILPVKKWRVDNKGSYSIMICCYSTQEEVDALV